VVGEWEGPGRVYADATALIGLARIDRLDLLTLLPTPIKVTDFVWREVAGNLHKPGVSALTLARTRGLLVVVIEGDAAVFPELDAGESSVLSAAAVAGAAVLVDERKARTVVGVDATLARRIRGAFGIVGLILLAKRRGRMPSVRPLLDELILENFWLGEALYREVLDQAGEVEDKTRPSIADFDR